jgi:hypothetical protein
VCAGEDMGEAALIFEGDRDEVIVRWERRKQRGV